MVRSSSNKECSDVKKNVSLFFFVKNIFFPHSEHRFMITRFEDGSEEKKIKIHFFVFLNVYVGAMLLLY